VTIGHHWQFARRPLESQMMRVARRSRVYKKYIVRLTDQERDELAALIKRSKGTVPGTPYLSPVID